MGEPSLGPDSSGGAISSSNIGFQLLKKHGWKEGTGLGISEQGRLEPVQAYLKTDKRGLGAKKKKKEKVEGAPKSLGTSAGKDDQGEPTSKKPKAPSKKMRKQQEVEKRLQDNEFQRLFFREFWPDNV